LCAPPLIVLDAYAPVCPPTCLPLYDTAKTWESTGYRASGSYITQYHVSIFDIPGDGAEAFPSLSIRATRVSFRTLKIEFGEFGLTFNVLEGLWN
jgi:hypothetical protein